MERHLGKGTYKFLFIYEFLGTAILLFGLNVSAPGNPFGVIFNILAIILVVGPITGAHLNPAVSTGVLISNKNIIPEIPIYLLTVLAEILGAMFGTLMAFSCT
jgi:glycerol uptake facilitator-like aquaporin